MFTSGPRDGNGITGFSRGILSIRHIIEVSAQEVKYKLSFGHNMIRWGMGWMRMRVAVCDVCGHKWIPETQNPPNCPRKACRSTLWNKGGVDGRTLEARIKAGRSRRTRASH